MCPRLKRVHAVEAAVLCADDQQIVDGAHQIDTDADDGVNSLFQVRENLSGRGAALPFHADSQRVFKRGPLEIPLGVKAAGPGEGGGQCLRGERFPVLHIQFLHPDRGGDAGDQAAGASNGEAGFAQGSSFQAGSRCLKYTGSLPETSRSGRMLVPRAGGMR